MGLVPFARIAREGAEAPQPPDRSPFSKHTVTQPSVLAIRCLMRYEDWTYREAARRLKEQVERRAARGLEGGAGTRLYCAVSRSLRCIAVSAEPAKPTGSAGTEEPVRRMPPARQAGPTVAGEGTGLAPG